MKQTRMRYKVYRSKWRCFSIVSGFCVLFVFLDQCTQTPSRWKAESIIFSLPKVPSVITSVEERAKYLIVHFWDEFDFADTTFIKSSDVAEQKFVQYISLFPQTTNDVVRKSISTILNKALMSNAKIFDYFTGFFEKYLYDPNSLFCQEDYYIDVLNSIIANDKVSEFSKIRPRTQLELTSKNRPGNKATDFEYIVSNGRSAKMSEISTDYLLLFFNNPDCRDCVRAKEHLKGSLIVNDLMRIDSRPSLCILAIYPDENIKLWRRTDYPSNWIDSRSSQVRKEQLYNLRAMPNLYLLDKDKRVILKDVSVEVVTQWLDWQR